MDESSLGDGIENENTRHTLHSVFSECYCIPTSMHLLLCLLSCTAYLPRVLARNLTKRAAKRTMKRFGKGNDGREPVKKGRKDPFQDCKSLAHIFFTYDKNREEKKKVIFLREELGNFLTTIPLQISFWSIWTTRGCNLYSKHFLSLYFRFLPFTLLSSSLENLL